jgi:hypothetical protein
LFAAIPLAKVLTDQHVWGRDFPAVLANMEQWGELGPQRISVERNQVVTDRRYSGLPAAQDALNQFLRLLPPKRGKDVELVRRLFQTESKHLILAEQVNSPEQTEPSLIEGNGGIRLGFLSGKELLAPELTATVLVHELGKPTKVTRKIIRSEFEARSEVLTSFTYSKGAVEFIQSSYSPTLPKTGDHIVDRAVLDGSQVVGLLREMRR